MTTAFFLAMAATPALSATMHVHDSNGMLGTVDTTTGAVSVIGDMGVVMTDIAFDPTGNLYGMSFTSLYRIDPGSGVSTLIGAHGISSGNALVFGADGTLYGAGNATTNIYTLNTMTGVGSSLGSIGFYSGGDLAFVGSDFYLASSANQLVKIDLGNPGGTAAVGSFGVSDVFGLATAPGGRLYGVAGTSIYEVDVTTGLATNPLSFAGHGLGIAYGQSFYTESGAEPAPVPVPPAGVLLAGGLVLLGRARRRGKALA
ncbi:hypothetical protein [Paracoccus sp. 22332]|uniref:hypothetical protein n=1 Tax=Paracoccus sp. 22332 TaxID=3453913 RepID=UPI003F833167